MFLKTIVENRLRKELYHLNFKSFEEVDFIYNKFKVNSENAPGEYDDKVEYEEEEEDQEEKDDQEDKNDNKDENENENDTDFPLNIEYFKNKNYDNIIYTLQDFNYLNSLLNIIFFIRNKDLACFSSNDNKKIKEELLTILHKFEAQNIIPISTRSNCNCLYNAISIALFGNVKIVDRLRILLSYIILKEKKSFYKLLRKRGYPEPEEHFKILIKQTLSPECEFGWGDDLNIIGLSILIQRPIYILNSHYNASFYSNYTNSKKSPIVIIHNDQHFTGT